MTTTNAQSSIRATLGELPKRDFADAARDLLVSLEYDSEKAPAYQSGDVREFVDTYPAPNQGTRSEREFIEAAKSVHIVFQVADDEIGQGRWEVQGRLMETSAFDAGRHESFIFVAIELAAESYPRGKYAAFTREINKRWQMPTVVLFRTATSLFTLAFVARRTNRRNESRDVLGRVSLIREIDPANPHRAHEDILDELSLPNRLAWMDRQGKDANFDGLLAAWLDTLDTDKLNKRFYHDLFTWFLRAVGTARFPTDEAITLDPEQHVIRLITRLLFVWFIKEKGLVNEDLFVEHQISELLQDYDAKSGDSYYRAILQNLFFATLNTEIDQRGFSRGGRNAHREFSLYRYADQIADNDGLLSRFAETPFINGGLFDCLDSFEATGNGGYRIDCFSDVHYDKLSIPNHLFFSQDDNKPGLITLFNRYKFTVTENTPAEQEVALDPELLGKVFENLLAAYNPETRETARKQTGSYYTPRPVVDSMVDEVLVAALAQKAPPHDGNPTAWEAKLRRLLDYGDYEEAGDEAENLTSFSDAERENIVRAIAGLKVLDPAVGSGAFPMGVLHKLTLALQRLDPINSLWETLQKELAVQRTSTAYDTDDPQERDVELVEISATFDRYRDTDYGRKLYLIQNSIYGVDIQPVATQIAKLRFFISLAIEQRPTNDAGNNYGIKPLPNLETRFVAANSLIGLGGLHRELTSDLTRELQRKLNANRERYFHATTRATKLQYRGEDQKLRNELAESLILSGLDAGHAARVAQWDPYDQNSHAYWFDCEYMFGIENGFDVVIGNPPYVRADSGEQHLELRRMLEESQQYETLWEKWDLYVPFIERSFKLLQEGGYTTLILSDAFCHAKYAQKSRQWFLKNSRIVRVDFFSKIQIFDAAVHNVTVLFQKAAGNTNEPIRCVHFPDLDTVEFLASDFQSNLTERVFFPEDSETLTFASPTLPLASICYVSVGMVVHADEKRAHGTFVLKDLVSEVEDDLHTKPFVEGKHIARWLPTTNKWLEWDTKRAPRLFRRPTFPQLYEVGEKLISVDMSASTESLRVAYDNLGLLHNHSAWTFVLWVNLSGVRNKSIKKQTRYRGEKPVRPDLPSREQLEDNSRRFSIKYLLGVMNSTVARDFLRANRRSNIHLYPDDWKKLPIPDVGLEQQAPVVDLVNQILDIKSANLSGDTSELEEEIDQLAYELYGLTEYDAVMNESGQITAESTIPTHGETISGG